MLQYVTYKCYINICSDLYFSTVIYSCQGKAFFERYTRLDIIYQVVYIIQKKPFSKNPVPNIIILYITTKRYLSDQFIC